MRWVKAIHFIWSEPWGPIFGKFQGFQNQRQPDTDSSAEKLGTIPLSSALTPVPTI